MTGSGHAGIPRHEATARPPSRWLALSSEAFWVGLSQGISILATLGLLSLLTGSLEPAAYGRLTLGLTLATLVNQVLTGALATGFGRYQAIAAQKGQLAGYYRAVATLLAVSAVGVLLAGALATGVLAWAGPPGWGAITAAAFATSLPGAVTTAFAAIQGAARKRLHVAGFIGLEACLRIGLAWGLVQSLGASVAGVLWAFAAASTLTACLQAATLDRPVEGSTPAAPAWRDYARDIWRFSAPAMVWGVFTAAQLASDRWALGLFGSTEEVARYAVLMQLGSAPATMLAGFATALLAPILFQVAGDATDPERLRRTHRAGLQLAALALLATGTAFLMAVVWHGPLVSVFTGDRYTPASPLLPWMVLAGGLFATGQMLALKFLSELRPAGLLNAKVTTAVLGVGLNLLGAHHAGLAGVVAAQVAFAGLYAAWMGGLVVTSAARGEGMSRVTP